MAGCGESCTPVVKLQLNRFEHARPAKQQDDEWGSDAEQETGDDFTH